MGLSKLMSEGKIYLNHIVSAAKTSLETYLSKRQPIERYSEVETDANGAVHFYRRRGPLKEYVGKLELEEDTLIFTNLAQDLMCFAPEKGFLGIFRKLRRLDYGEKVNFEKNLSCILWLW